MENQPNSNGNGQKKETVHKDQIQRGFWDLVSGLGIFLRDMFDLQSDLDREGTIENISNNKRMRGANVWLLGCSIMVASLGLDLNSPAVIIGAMLISPLMSPILGIGLGVGINDKETLWISVQHFGIAIVIALTVSVVYFWITPFGEMTNEIDARTRPTLLDAGVAIFGGLAGIISSSRKDKSNAIPGVAIATALMPPLCVAGFGLAKGHWDVFLNAFYLFFLNSVFIALTTYLIVRFLRFPFASYLNRREKARTSLVITVFSIVVLLPSTFILYNVWKEHRVKRDVKAFMALEFNSPTRDYLNHKIEAKDSITYVIINYYSKVNKPITQDTLDMLNSRLAFCGLQNPRIIPYGTTNFEALLEKQRGEVEARNNEKLDEFAKLQQEKDNLIRQLEFQKDSIAKATTIKSVVAEARVFHPHLEDIDLVQSRFDEYPILLMKWDPDVLSSMDERQEVYEFVKIKTGLDTLVVY